MTERSWLWGGTATGDATLAPYAKEAFNQWFAAPKSHDEPQVVYVLPGYSSNLIIEPQAAQTFSSLTIKAGMAVVGNYVYELTENTFVNIRSLQTRQHRYDSVVLRITRDDMPKVRLAVVEGFETTNFPPDEPVLTQETAGTWEVEIARIYIDSDNFVLDGTYLRIKTQYLPVGEYYNPNPPNILPNSEWLAVYDSTSPGTKLPTGWGAVGPPTWTAVTPLAPSKRGNALKVTAGGFLAICALPPGTGFMTLEGVIQNNSTDSKCEIEILYVKDEGSLLYSDIKERDKIGFNDTSLDHFKTTFEVPADVDHIWFYVQDNSSVSPDYSIGQLILSPGFFTGGLREIHDIIILDDAIEDTAWDGDSKSTGTTTINLATSFGGNVPQGISGVILSVLARDSGSNGSTNCYLTILPYTSGCNYGYLYLEGSPNDSFRHAYIIAYINEPFITSPTTTRGFRIQVQATGGSTMDVWAEIVGYIT